MNKDESKELGNSLVAQLKAHVFACISNASECASTERGLGNIELEQICGLDLHLKSQDHYLTYSILQALLRDGVIEVVRHADDPRHPKYRLA